MSVHRVVNNENVEVFDEVLHFSKFFGLTESPTPQEWGKNGYFLELHIKFTN